MKLDLITGINLYNKAHSEKIKEQLYNDWVSLHAHMDRKSFISFEDYYEKYRPQAICVKTKQQMLAESKRIRAMIEGR